MTTSPSLALRLPKLVAACATLLDDERASVDARLAACAALAGAQGKRAFTALVAALDDGSARVREAAVDALVASCTGPHAPRIVHAAWHKRSDVRRLALHLASLPEPAWPPLLADPVLADDAAATLLARASVEPAAFAVVVTRHRARPDASLAIVVEQLPWSAPGAFLRALPHRRTTTARGTVAGGDDHLIDVFGVVADTPPLVDLVASGLVVAIRRHLLAEDELSRVADALVVVGAMRGTLPAPLLAVAIDVDLGVLDNDALPLADRRAACRALLTLGVARHDDVFARAAGVLGIDDHDDHHDLDVDVVAGLMRLCSDAPYRQLSSSIAPTSLAPSIWRQRATAVLSLVPTNAVDRDVATGLTAAVAAAAAYDDHDVDIVALGSMAVAVADPVSLLAPFIDRPGLAATVLAAIVAGDDHGTVVDLDAAHAERRLERVVELLVRRLDAAALAGIVRRAADQLANAWRCDRVAIVLDAVVRTAAPSTVLDVVDSLGDRERVPFVAWLVPRLPTSFPVGDADDRALAVGLRRARAAQQRRPLTDDEVTAIVVADDHELAAALSTLLRAGRRSGVVAALQRRASLPSSAALVAAVLDSADPIVDVATTMLDLMPVLDAPALEALRTALRATSTRTLLAAAFADDDDVLHREAGGGPGGLLGALELALSLPEPIAVVVVVALRRCARDDEHRAGRVARVVERLDVLLATAHGRWRAALLPWRAMLAPPPPPARSAIDNACAALCAGRADAGLDLDVDTRVALLHGAIVAGVKGLAANARALPREARDAIALAALDGADATERHDWLALLPPSSSSSSSRLEVLRDLAGWAARQSLQLVGRPLGLTWVGDALGYTRLTSSRIHINPLPVLLDERDGVDIVRGLIAHELGHHRHHASPAALTIWQRAERDDLTRLLNLVADEHLERNLRALSPAHGQRLHRLAAWAFQHRRKALPVDDVLVAVGPHPAALIGASLTVAGVAGHVVVDVGSLLGDLERRGSSFSRFMRALRMGKGDRHHDPLVARGLAFFAGPDFKTATMPRLLEIARQLRAIFGDDVKQLRATDFHRLADADDDELASSGVHPDELDAAGAAPAAHRRSSPARRTRNDGDDIAFDDIDRVVHVDTDGLAARALLRDVRRPAARLRTVLTTFGQASHIEQRRLQGQRLDRSALLPLVVHNDPRVLRRRHHARAADVFVGVAIDCSGSMRGDGLARAQRFAAVIAGACRDLVDVDARFIGFNDTTLFDAGDARRFGAAGLVADGGNNDAAAVAFLTRLARRSSRSVKLLVMISDGAPTECSVAAVRHVVDIASRQGIVCLQVAVAPIDEPCFGDHVLIDDDDDDAAVRRFATLIERRLTGAGRQRRASTATTTYTQATYTQAAEDE